MDIAVEKHPSILADISVSLPLRESEFQTCFAFNLLEHLYEFDNLLREIFRVLTPGGRLYIAIPFLLRVHPDPHDYARYTGQYLERRLAEAGFSSVFVEPCGWGAVTAALSQLDFLVVRIFRGSVLRMSILLDKLITKRSGGAYRNSSDYPIGYFASATKPITQ
ncbi:MAG: methyltransferase domain-containing protein [Chloroflexi bacterium]|nr:methyltransferase domain-containing protein [Chloroflexota bacterium]